MELKKVIDSLTESLNNSEINVGNINSVISILEKEKVFFSGYELDDLENALELNGIEIKINLKEELPYCMMVHTDEELKAVISCNYDDNEMNMKKDFPSLFENS